MLENSLCDLPLMKSRIYYMVIDYIELYLVADNLMYNIKAIIPVKINEIWQVRYVLSVKENHPIF